jgi:hypothetical protein
VIYHGRRGRIKTKILARSSRVAVVTSLAEEANRKITDREFVFSFTAVFVVTDIIFLPVRIFIPPDAPLVAIADGS